MSHSLHRHLVWAMTGVICSWTWLASASAQTVGNDSARQVLNHRDQTLAKQNDSANAGVDNYFDPKRFETDICKPGQGMWQLGAWGLWALPLPVYREDHGWDITMYAGLSYGADRPKGAVAEIRISGEYNEWEDRTGSTISLWPWVLRRKNWTVSTPVERFDLPERQGWAAAGRVDWDSRPGYHWGTARVRLAAERFTSRTAIGPLNWETGQHTWVAIEAQGHGFGQGRLRDLDLELNSRIGTNAGDGDFVYRRVCSKLVWARTHASLWLSAGSSSGNIPQQGLFDIATDGQIRSIPLWVARTERFGAAGLEGRARVFEELFVGGFATTAAGTGLAKPVRECGVTLILALRGDERDSYDWLLRIDAPVYSSRARAYGGTQEWDPRRLTIAINFPIPDIDREDLIRYRYLSWH